MLCRNCFGPMAAAFGLGLLLASLLPFCMLLPLASVVLIAGGLLLSWH